VLSVSENIDHYLSEFDRFENLVRGTKPDWIEMMRRTGIGHFADAGFPTTRDEEYRFTNFAPLLRHSFRWTAGVSPTGEAAEDRASVLKEFRVPDPCSEIVFWNGVYSPRLSAPSHLPKGAICTNLSESIVLHPELVRPYLGTVASNYDPFAALNTSFLHEGAFVFLPDNTVLNQPLHFVFLSGGDDHEAAYYPRNLIVVGKSVNGTILESYISYSDGVYFTNALTEIVLGENSDIRHYKLQRESKKSFHVANTEIRQQRNSSLSSLSITLGGQITRNNLNVILDGEGAEAHLDGLYLLSGNQHADNHTAIDHAKPHCTSLELYKGVLSGHSGAVFNGKVVVRKDAQKTNARQTNKNLLLSEGTHVNTKPQLEISADDVKCTHGATIGQLEQEPLFYLKSRGIDEALARRLMTSGFVQEIIDGIPADNLREKLQAVVADVVDRQVSEQSTSGAQGVRRMSEGRTE
jgi:Fe-S cluster assembly protein SufD